MSGKENKKRHHNDIFSSFLEIPEGTDEKDVQNQ